MLRKGFVVVAAFIALAVGACGFGPTSPMPPEDDMLIVSAADSVAR